MSVEVGFHSTGTSPVDNSYNEKRSDNFPQICYRCSSQIISRPENMSEIFRDKLAQALEERDEIWRSHEQTQISYLQDQHSQMLARLHAEIERMHGINRDLERRLYVCTEPAREEIENLEEEVRAEKEKSDRLSDDLNASKKRNASLEQTFERTTNMYKEQLKLHEERIRQLTSELHDRTLTVTQLSTQLRNIKLREAIAQAQQRKRVSCESPKQISPTSAFRLFNTLTGDGKSYKVDLPSTSLLKNSATVTVSQPQQGRRPQFIGSQSYARRATIQNSFDSSSPRNNIEKPSISRSLSSGITSPSRQNMLASLRNANTGGAPPRNL